jgi:D-beta-D-heptose 7-phosphate kinase/D-beta-D-heptose 1-phosphate adenosyltransferase
MILNTHKLEKVVKKFKGKRILVVGDLILDHYIFGEAERISPEAPVPVVCAGQEKFVGGGALNVAINLKELGAEVGLCGTVGDDYFGNVLLSIVKEKGIDASLVLKDPRRPTTLKTRVMAFHQQVVRVDWESKEFLSLPLNSAIVRKLKRAVKKFEGVIIEDYGKGVINPYFIDELVHLCKKHNRIITVDPKEDHFDYYQDVTALTPNLKEAQIAANMRIRSKEEMTFLGERIMNTLKPQALLITMGEEGMRLFINDGTSAHIPTYTVEVYDVTGAGDTVIAVFTLSLLSGGAFLEAAVIANIAAGIVVGKRGAATSTRAEIVKRIREETIKTHSSPRWK